jgi:hypothetical protein
VAITFDSFEFTFKSLCNGLGKKFEKHQCEQYFEDLREEYSNERWGRVATWWRRNHATFPKISELLKL